MWRAGAREPCTLLLACVAFAASHKRLAKRRAEIRRILASLGAPAAETRRAAAVVRLLASSEAGIPLLDMHGLSLEAAGEAAAESVEAIIERLRALGARR